MVNIIAEIGINYAYGKSIENFIFNAKRLIDIAEIAGCTHVKFQKRTPELAVPEEKKSEEKAVPWHSKPISYLQYKEEIEFSKSQMSDLYSYAMDKGLIPFSSVWDLNSAKDISEISENSMVKIPSAHLTNHKLLQYCRNNFLFRLLSTGMSYQKEIDEAEEILNPSVIFHTNSNYPCKVEDLNLGYINYLKRRYNREIGFSNHYYGIVPIFATVALGIDWVEVHITEDHRFWGTDQSSSVEPVGLIKLVKGIRGIEKALKYGDEERIPYPGELEKKRSLYHEDK